MCIPSLLMGNIAIFSSFFEYGSGITEHIVANFTNVYALLTPLPTWATWVTNPLLTQVGGWFCVFILGIITLMMYYKRLNIIGSDILLLATMYIVIVCNFLPGIHDRYMILADILSCLYVISSRRIKDVWIPAYINFVSSFNILNYLHGIPAIPELNVISATRIILVQLVSIAFFALSIYFVYYVLKTLKTSLTKLEA